MNKIFTFLDSFVSTVVVLGLVLFGIDYVFQQEAWLAVAVLLLAIWSGYNAVKKVNSDEH